MKTRKPRIITFGEALVEIMRTGAGQPLEETGGFQGPFASGAPAIFAVVAARCGMDVGFIGTVGVDAFGRFFMKRLETEGVDVSFVAKVSELSTGVAFVAYLENGERDFVFHLRGSAAGEVRNFQIQEKYFTEVRWLHISGSTLLLNEAWRSTAADVLRLTRAAGARISLDPNLRPNLLPNEAAIDYLEPWIRAADVIFPTKAEACLLTNESDIHTAALKLLRRRGQVVVIKHGDAGCTIYTRDARIDVPGFPVDEVDPTGAGDAFAAAFITGIEMNLSFEQSARQACAAGALAVTRLGPMEGIASMDDIQRFLQNDKTV